MKVEQTKTHPSGCLNTYTLNWNNPGFNNTLISAMSVCDTHKSVYVFESSPLNVCKHFRPSDRRVCGIEITSCVAVWGPQMLYFQTAVTQTDDFLT